MTKQQEIKAAFCKGLEAVLLNCEEAEAMLEVINGYIDELNNFIDGILAEPANNGDVDLLDGNFDDSAAYVDYACADNNDTILITAHQGSESVKLAAIKRGNAGAFTEFIHIGSAESITVNSAKDIEKALFRMLEAPALITILYRLICQSHSMAFNNLDYGDKLFAMINGTDKAKITSIPNAIKRFKPAEAKAAAFKSIEESLNQFCEHFNVLAILDGNQFSIERSNEMPDELLLVVEYLNQNARKETLVKFKTQNGAYPVTVEYGEDDPVIVPNESMLGSSFFSLMHTKLPYHTA
ncbi:hypothetical protein SASC598J21_017990 [Snodgrassella alvi SCGC AB-598-J21]|uniref:Uncharacterized protein n=1 Tax=Snodgrassella alvi SCGC AB-598-J21 TaxID=1385367 RepID=A0A074V4S7_9NEIS|nr:hypothetical protein SASC598J21_017990 [Snodgrassella alvi SCGC AB-598-J21]